jgi:hypothetical protein
MDHHGNSDRAQQLSNWAEQQQQQQLVARLPRYTMGARVVGPPNVFVSVLQDFLVEQYRAAGRQPDLQACAALAVMMAARLSPASWQSYGSTFGASVRFCLGRQPAFLPADQSTGLLWAQHLAASCTVQASTSQPYFSAVNTVHHMLGLPRPCADNPMLTSFRRGWERQQQPIAPLPAVAGLALPPRLAFSLYTALPGLSALRRVLFCCLCYCLMLRPASLLSVQWLRMSQGFLQYIPLHWNNKRLQPDKAPVLQFPVSRLPFLAAAVARFSAQSGAARPFWQLLGDSSSPTTVEAEAWFASACDAARFSAADRGYTLYSTRRGGASAAAAVGVPLHKVEAFGGWGVGS